MRTHGGPSVFKLRHAIAAPAVREGGIVDIAIDSFGGNQYE
jgi:hypothetical protein